VQRVSPDQKSGSVAGLVGIEGGVVSGVINLESPALKRRAGDHAMKNVTRGISRGATQDAAGVLRCFDFSRGRQ
jgi:hypothetical protein